MVMPTNKPPLLHLAKVQLAAAVTAALVIAALKDWSLLTFASALSGGLVVVLSWGYFGWRSFRHTDHPDGEQLHPRQLLGEFFRAGLGKFLLVAVFLGLLFRFGSSQGGLGSQGGLDSLAVLTGFTATLVFGGCLSLVTMPGGAGPGPGDAGPGDSDEP